MLQKQISSQTLRRLPLYLNYLRALPEDIFHISATQIAGAIGLGDVQVRKDLAAASGQGKPKTGYERKELILAVERLLKGGEAKRFCIVGMGQLGAALAQYQGFTEYGLQLAAAFDIQPDRIGREIGGVKVMAAPDIGAVCRGENIHVAVIAVPSEEAQAICDALVDGGVRTIWNFAPTHLKAPPEICIEHENMAAQLGLMSRHLRNRIR